MKRKFHYWVQRGFFRDKSMPQRYEGNTSDQDSDWHFIEIEPALSSEPEGEFAASRSSKADIIGADTRFREAKRKTISVVGLASIFLILGMLQIPLIVSMAAARPEGSSLGIPWQIMESLFYAPLAEILVIIVASILQKTSGGIRHRKGLLIASIVLPALPWIYVVVPSVAV